MSERLTIEIPEGFDFQEARFFARIEGLTPLLMHKPNLQGANGKVQKSGKNIPTPADEAEAGAYRLPTGELMLPAVAVQRSMVEAARHFKNPEYTRQTMMRPIAASLVPPDVEGYVLTNGNGEVVQDYVVDTRRAVVQRQGILRSRPRLDQWACIVEMRYDRGSVDPKLLAGILATAGTKVGVLEHRPDKAGPYGRFRVQSFEVEA